MLKFIPIFAIDVRIPSFLSLKKINYKIEIFNDGRYFM